MVIIKDLTQKMLIFEAVIQTNYGYDYQVWLQLTLYLKPRLTVKYNG